MGHTFVNLECLKLDFLFPAMLQFIDQATVQYNMCMYVKCVFVSRLAVLQLLLCRITVLLPSLLVIPPK